MTAFTDVTLVVSQPAPAGGNGAHWAFGTAVGTGSYDTAGSVIDMSGIFKTQCVSMWAYVDDADIRLIFVPAASYATATGKIFKDNNAGTEATAADNLSSTCAVTHWVALGVD